MNGICWRLLAVVLLIFVAPAFLRGQGADVDRSRAPIPVLSPIWSPLRHSSPIAPVWIPPPNLPAPQPAGRYPAEPGPVIFSQLVRAAGIIFSGHVISIGRTPSSPGQAPVSTSVTFQVEHAMRGASPGQSLTIHEWAGLWSSGERYRVGEHVLLFLYSPSKLGLTSPVAGALGRFAVDSQGRIVLSARHVAFLAADPVLGGKAVISYADFIQAVRRSGKEE
jgi:hypothetical protein